MDNLKDAHKVATAVNLFATVGGLLYLNQQISTMKEDMVKMKTAITGFAKKFQELEKDVQSKTEAMHRMNGEIKHVSEHLDDVPTRDELEDLENGVDAIISAVGKKDIKVELPPPPRYPTPRTRRAPTRDEYSRVPTVRGARNDRSRTDSTRDSGRDRQSERQSDRRDTRRSTRQDDDEDLDLIDQVRDRQASTRDN